ncbi:unnamed protein product [Calypogeia fissa]
MQRTLDCQTEAGVSEHPEYHRQDHANDLLPADRGMCIGTTLGRASMNSSTLTDINGMHFTEHAKSLQWVPLFSSLRCQTRTCGYGRRDGKVVNSASGTNYHRVIRLALE